MIVVDTHVWVWWTLDTGRLSAAQRAAISRNEDDLIGVSAISCLSRLENRPAAGTASTSFTTHG